MQKFSLEALKAMFMPQAQLPKVYPRQLVRSSGTFSAGRNAEKRKARQPGAYKARMDMLANRRLRQRGLAA